jgi:3-isopropylmalate/(R)-2-methylmalate dehydratase small subunit
MIVSGNVLPLDHANIDTDQIVPSRYLVGLATDGLGDVALSGMPKAASLLRGHDGAAIIVARENFGCGSSREHAVWALMARGVKVIIAPSFARIFGENAYNNGLVPVVVPDSEIAELLQSKTLDIDIDAEEIVLPSRRISFHLDPLRKSYLAGGFLQFMLEAIPDVREWEAAHLRTPSGE